MFSGGGNAFCSFEAGILEYCVALSNKSEHTQKKICTKLSLMHGSVIGSDGCTLLMSEDAVTSLRGKGEHFERYHNFFFRCVQDFRGDGEDFVTCFWKTAQRT